MNTQPRPTSTLAIDRVAEEASWLQTGSLSIVLHVLAFVAFFLVGSSLKTKPPKISLAEQTASALPMQTLSRIQADLQQIDRSKIEAIQVQEQMQLAAQMASKNQMAKGDNKKKTESIFAAGLKALTRAAKKFETSTPKLQSIQAQRRIGAANLFADDTTRDQSIADSKNSLLIASREPTSEFSGKLQASVLAEDSDSKATISTRMVEIVGGLAADLVRRIVQERIGSLRICYEQALLSQPNVEGEIAMKWTVQSNGLVDDVSIQSSEIDDAELHTCMTERVQKWTFPAPQGGGIVHILYPFYFKKVDG